MKIIRFTFLLLLLFVNALQAQQITVNNTFTNQQLVNDFINGTCTQISNIQINGHIFPDGTRSWGYFNKAQSTFPFDEGIVLTTGKLSAAPGPTNAILSDGPSSWTGDIDLQNAVNINNTYNATSLVFEFTPTANTIKFDYIFASEQYLINGTPSQCNYTDGFAFILTNLTAGTAPQNLALVPGTTTPVTSSTIRGAGGLCPVANPQYFASYNNISSPIAYNGNTVPMNVEATVVPGNTYRIKIVIADQGNALYDSAVFLRANSFNAEIDLGTNRLIATNNAVCANETLTLNATTANATYKWFKNGVEITGQSQATYNVTTPGVYKVIITQANGCVTEGSITVEYDILVYNQMATLQICGTNGQNSATFNLDEARALIMIDPVDSITFYQNNNGGQLSGIINNEQAFNATNGTLIYAKIISETGCEYIGTVRLEINSENIEPVTQLKCDTDNNTSDGITNFNLFEIGQTIREENNYNQNYIVEFFPTVQDANNNSNQLPNNYSNTTPYLQEIYAKVSINNTCVAIIKVILKVSNSQIGNTSHISVCQGDIETLTASSPNNIYLWNTGATTQTIEVTTSGTYTVTYFSADGCEITESFIVTVTSGPEEVSLITTDNSGSDNSITVIVSNGGIYEYSLNGVDYQLSNTFRGLAVGPYTVYVRDVKGCGEKILTTYILDYPRFLTPNNDGYNDTWRIPNLTKVDPYAKIYIFDRFGQLIYEMPAQFSWDGTRNGKLMPPTDYWFLVKYTNGKELRGHFSLIR